MSWWKRRYQKNLSQCLNCNIRHQKSSTIPRVFFLLQFKSWSSFVFLRLPLQGCEIHENIKIVFCQREKGGRDSINQMLERKAAFPLISSQFQLEIFFFKKFQIQQYIYICYIYNTYTIAAPTAQFWLPILRLLSME